MTSMSYCQWESAAAELDQCIDAFNNEGKAMVERLVKDHENGYPTELEGLKQAIELAKQLIELAEPYDEI